jgi:peptidyl-prolyl cis-trans isomerase C
MSTEQIQARHILVENQYEAEDLLRKFNAGTPFEELAQKFSRCPSSKQGGDLGSFTRGRMVEEFSTAAFALGVGEVSPPVRTQFGYHLIQRTN